MDLSLGSLYPIKQIVTTCNWYKFFNKSNNELVASYERKNHKIDEIINKVKNAGMEIYDNSTDDGDLEDVFLRLTKN